MNEVGINLTMTEQASQVAPKVSSALRGIAEAGEDMKAALELGDLEQKYKAFADRVDKIQQQQQTNRQISSGSSGGNVSSVGNFGNTAISSIRQTGSVIGKVGAGDAGGAGNDVIGMASSVLKGAGPIGWALASLGALAFAGNELSKVYEKHMTEVMDINNALGRFGSTAEETGKNFEKTMNTISGDASRYGYDLQTGMQVYKQLTSQAGTATSEAAREVMYFQRSGFDQGSLSSYMAKGMRYGAGTSDQMLGQALGMANQGGVPRGLFSEFLSGSEALLEDALSRGVVKGFDEIGKLQAGIGTMGAQYQGQAGLGLLQKLTSSVVGSTAMGSDADIMNFRTMRRTLEAAGKPSDYMSVMKALEGGTSQEFEAQSVQDALKMAGGNRNDAIELLVQNRNLSYTQANDLLNRYSGGAPDISTAYALPSSNLMGTSEVAYGRVSENMANRMRQFGRRALNVKSAFLNSTLGPMIEKFGDLLIDRPAIRAEDNKIDEERRVWDQVSGFNANIEKATSNKPWMTGTGMAEMGGGKFELHKLASQVGGNYNQYKDTNTWDATMKLKDLFVAANEDSLKYLADNDFMTRANQVAKDFRSEGEARGNMVTPNDMPVILELLIKTLENFNQTVSKEKQIQIFSIIGDER